MQQTQHRSQCWKHSLKSLTEMPSRAASDSRWTSAMSPNCLPFKSCFIHGNQTSRKERGQVNGGDTNALLFLAKRKAFCWRCRGSTRIAGGTRQHFCWRR